MSIDAAVANGIKWLRDTAGRIVGYRNPVTDQDEAAAFGDALDQEFDPLDLYDAGTIGEELALNKAARNTAVGTANEIDIDDSVPGQLTWSLSDAINAYSETVVAIANQVAMATATWKTVASITLTAGTYDLEGVVIFNGDGTTTVAAVAAGTSTQDNTLPGTQYYASQTRTSAVPPNNLHQVTPSRRVTIAAETTYYLVAFVSFGVAAMNCYGTLKARRAR